MAIRRTGSQTLVNRGVTAAAATPVNIITGSGGGGATVNISSIQIANSTFVAKDDLAIDTAGGYMIINGTGFQSGAVAYIQGTAATSTSFVSSSRLNVTVPALSSGLLDVYVVNTDGSGSIYLRSLNANGTPSWTTTSPLTTQDIGSAFAINLVASGAAGDGTITYAVSAGSTLPSGTFLASNGYFYGTVSGIETETTYSFSVDAIDAQNQETARSFNITVRAGDQYLKNTVLLLNAETSNNTWITDTSTNNFALTVNGDTRPVAFSPYETVWSNFFDGTGDYLSIPDNAAFNFGSQNFTIESWINPTSLPSLNSIAVICSQYVESNSRSFLFAIYNNAGTYQLLFQPVSGSTQTVISQNCTFNIGEWIHISVVRSGNNITLYRNGISLGTTSYSSTINDATGAFLIGARFNDGTIPAVFFNGYVSNLRVVNGTAVYTANFTPPTSSLTAIANTSLLTCQSNRLIDNSTNNFTITKNGDVSVSNFGPFVETDITTGSGYFDGSGDYIRKSGSGVLTTNGDVTIECWIYPFSTSIVGIFDGGSGEVNIIRSYGTNKISKQGQEGTGASFTVVANTWQHFACTLSNGNIKTYINGTQSGTGTYTSGYAAGSNFDIGGINATGDGAFNGYISNFRVVNTVVYTGNFTPPNQPLTLAGSSTIYPSTTNVNTSFSSTSTSLLTLQSRIGENNNRFVDSSGINNIITRNGNATQGTFTPYSLTGWSNYFDTSGDSLTVPYSSLLALGTGDCTIESWVLISSWPQQFNNVLDVRESASGPTSYLNNAISFGFENNGKFVFYAGSYSASTAVVETASAKIALNTWYHVAMTRSSGTTRLYINGVQEATSSNSWNQTSGTATTLYIGNALAGRQFNGYISNLRILKGTALYTSNFTTPTLPLTAVANTSLLTCADNGFIDKSPNNFAITRNGDVSVQPFSPFKVHTYTANTHSVYFDGTGDYLSIPDSQTFMNIGTNNLTIEGWVYFTSVGTGTFFGAVDSGGNSSGGVIIYLSASGTLKVFGPSVSGTITTSVVTGTWYHIAVTRQTNTWTLWLNGTSQGTFTDSGSLNPGSSRPLAIGRLGAYDGFYLTGYVSNVRFINGTALYTSTFTPPTSPLTAIANTSLLTCSSNTIVDLSTANTGNTAYAITVNGDARATTVNPLGFTVTNVTGTSADYSITDEGGSVYFDGNADFLKIDTTNILTWSGTTTFTVEGWFYQTAFDATSGFMNNVIGDLTPNSSFGDALYWSIGMNNSNQPGIRWYGGPTTCNATEALTLFRWNHVAWVVSSGVLSIYINGKKATLSGTSTITAAAASMNYVVVGADRGKYYSGYMSGLRVVKGTALYTSGFVPPAAPPLPIAGSSLLINGTNGSIIDYTRKNNLETVGDVKIRNNIVKYGNTSMFFDGTGDSLKFISNNPNLTLGSGDFTIEGWFYQTATTFYGTIFTTTSTWTTSNQLRISTGNNNNTLRVASGNSDLFDSNSTFTNNNWHHFALSRSGTTLRLFLNGTQVGSITNSTNFVTDNFTIGNTTASGTDYYFQGYIDDFRITKGVARYTSNFSVPNKHPTN